MEEYEKIIKRNGYTKKLYSKQIIKLPAPEFYIIYTGDRECSEYLCLADAFPEEYKNNDFLQLKVKVITNSGSHNILGGCIAFAKKAEELYNVWVKSVFIQKLDHKRITSISLLKKTIALL